jgi:protein tyrosine phosphatase (PTP) superfamily phosphohydrolase (DUF442 family)
MMRTLSRVGMLILSVASVATLGCNPPRDAPALQTATLGDAPNVHRYTNFTMAGQPSAADFEIARDNGTLTVVDLRLSNEDRGFDEAELVSGLGMTYHNIGFKSRESLSDEVFDNVRKVLREAAGSKVLIHCSTANRVGTVWLVYRVLDDGLAYDEAAEEARTIGMRTPDFAERAQEYIKARNPSGSGSSAAVK